MRTTRTHGLAMMMVALLAAACGEDDGDSDLIGPETPNGTMTATVDGEAWAAVQIAATQSNGFVAISGGDGSGLALGFAIQDEGTGTYSIGPTSTASANVIDNLSVTWTANGNEGSGTITITTLTETTASGTFSYTAHSVSGSDDPPQRTVTNGQFDVTFN